MSNKTISRAVTEVREWREKLQEEFESWGDISSDDFIKKAHKKAEAFKKENGLNLRTISLSKKGKAKTS